MSKVDWTDEGDLPEFDVTTMKELEKATTEKLPDAVKTFVVELHNQLKNQNVDEISELYEQQFPRLSEKFYKNSLWPAAKVVAPLVQQDEIFLLFYKEMTYRHLYSKIQPNLQQRVASFENYTSLFNFVLKSEKLKIDLPNGWIWDIIEEYLYQFQSCSHYRCKVKSKSSQNEMNYLLENKNIWSYKTVLNTLENIVSKSGIIDFLKKEDQVSFDDVLNPGEFHLLRMLGFYSLIGLLRIKCLVADFQGALESIASLDIDRRDLFSHSLICHITIRYFVGMAYLMLKRFVDAIHVLSTFLLQVSRMKQFLRYSDLMVKRIDQLCALLAIAITIHPYPLDSAVKNMIMEKYGDKITRMQKGDESVFEELLNFACPRFIVLPENEMIKDWTPQTPQAQFRKQFKDLYDEIRQQLELHPLKNILKLYTSVPIQTVASSLGIDVDTLKKQLERFKKEQIIRGEGEAPHEGRLQNASGIDITMKGDMLRISHLTPQKDYMGFFKRMIKEFDGMIIIK